MSWNKVDFRIKLDINLGKLLDLNAIYYNKFYELNELVDWDNWDYKGYVVNSEVEINEMLEKDTLTHFFLNEDLHLIIKKEFHFCLDQIYTFLKNNRELISF